MALVNVALGHGRLDWRVVALCLAIAGMVAVVASQLDPAAGIRFDAFGFGLALGAALSQAVFTWSSAGPGIEASRPTRAMGVILAVTVICTRARGSGDRGPGRR